MSKVRLFLLTVPLLAAACVQTPQRPSSGHLLKDQLPDKAHLSQQVPKPVTQMPVVPEPTPAVAQETFSVVVTDVPLDQLLFALARDAKINVDVHPGLSGHVTLNAIDQTLLQILDRIAAQVPIRYRFENQLLVVEPDQPYLRSYYIDYVNLTRSSSTSNRDSQRLMYAGDGIPITLLFVVTRRQQRLQKKASPAGVGLFCIMVVVCCQRYVVC